MAEIGTIGSGAASGAADGSSLGPWGALAGGVIGGAASWWLGNKAADAQKAASLEEERRRERERAFVLGDATARANASGVEVGVPGGPGSESMSKYLADLSMEFQRQHAWAVSQANQGADLSKLANGINAMSGIGSSIFRWGQSNAWGASPAPAIR